MADSKRAVLIGASVAGLLAARALTDHFEEVVIIDRDRLPETSEFRKGIFDAGAQPIDWTRDVLFLWGCRLGYPFPT